MKTMPVLLPVPERLQRSKVSALPFLRLSWWQGAALAGFVLLTAQAAPADASQQGTLGILAHWTPLLLSGLWLNILISICSMAMGTLLGIPVGLGLVSPNRLIRNSSWVLTQFFRNAPMLVLLFFMIYLLPFRISLGGATFAIPDWLKAVVGLGFPVMANVAEIVRGGVRSIHPGQWEAAESLGFTRHQQLYSIILPQAFKRMLPPWVNLYAILATSTTLASIVGVDDVVTRAGQVLAATGNNPSLLAPIYGYVLLMFFIFTYPVALATRYLERRTKVRI